MIERHTAQCDRCSNYEERNGLDFKETIEFLKDSGWKIFKVGNVWLHYCNVCNSKTAIPQQPKTNSYWWDKQ